MMFRLILVSLFAMTALTACEPEADSGHYILALSWQPGFCAGNADKKECGELDGGDFAATNLVLHGLWPNLPGGADSLYCDVTDSTRKVDEAGKWCSLPVTGADEETQSDLAEVMPGSESCLDRHEWTKH